MVSPCLVPDFPSGTALRGSAAPAAVACGVGELGAHACRGDARQLGRRAFCTIDGFARETGFAGVFAATWVVAWVVAWAVL
eukprot:4447287-Pleurochrysis_carterae.AAC.2